jgi:DNA-binding response OmpR family regulator
LTLDIGRILIADDDPPSLELLVTHFEALGYVVHGAGDGNRALELGTTNAYDVVIVDINMPIYDGVEVLEFLRRRHLRHPVAVIAVTADPSAEIRVAAARAGVDRFIGKPLNLKALTREVEALIGQSRKQRYASA